MDILSPPSSGSEPAAPPGETFLPWRRAQLEVDRLATDHLIAPRVLRTTGFLGPALERS